MIHPDTEVQFINDEIGYGVVAKKLIPKGTIVWVLDKLDRSFTQKEINEFEDIYKEILETYTYRNSNGDYVLCWDHGRYVNHSFQSNCMSTAYDFEIAIKDIHPGDQLTDDYGYLNISKPFRGIDERTKRKTVYPDDLKKYYRIWDKKIYEALPFIKTVKQPLQPLIPSEIMDEIHQVLKGTLPLKSILTCYYGMLENNVNP